MENIKETVIYQETENPKEVTVSLGDTREQEARNGGFVKYGIRLHGYV